VLPIRYDKKKKQERTQEDRKPKRDSSLRGLRFGMTAKGKGERIKKERAGTIYRAPTGKRFN